MAARHCQLAEKYRKKVEFGENRLTCRPPTAWYPGKTGRRSVN